MSRSAKPRKRKPAPQRSKLPRYVVKLHDDDFFDEMTAFTLMTRRGICEMQNVDPDGKGIRLELIGFRENETIPDTLH
ncbi:hypothetical protein EJG37_004216 [Escherichia coli]|uniref:hypothetical protein n=1 Tax=Escherichia coli TaxID=562 RepID=UPI0012CF42D7|nr:hypothetical protein [Escherichia coli]HAZ0466782.1 hypothetical protein [Shigella sonnei]EED1650515.1 hypothetical protein [Escherichia coli]EEQ5762726.1 hypothetical protein [Escherichia coli]EEQ5955123.1 hypothetical protein [Escherichia coli]